MGKSNWLDKSIAYFSPKLGQQRQANRTLINLQKQISNTNRNTNYNASYNGAVPTRMGTPWNPSENIIGFSYLNNNAQTQLRDRSRTLERNNGLVNGIFNRLVDNVIGSGFSLQVTSGDPEWNKLAEERLRWEFENIDITGMCWSEHQRLMYRALKRDGDCGSILTNFGKIQAIQGDLIRSPADKQNDTRFSDGVECDAYGKPINYYICSNTQSQLNIVPNIIKAEDFVFLSNRKSFVSMRGEPCLSQSFGLIDQLDNYIEAVIVAARIAACYGLVVNKVDAKSSVKGNAKQTNSDGTSDRIEGMQPGMVAYLNPGESITQINPNQPGSMFPDTVSTLMRVLGINVNLPLELIFLDWSKTSYSSARASLLQAYRSMKADQKLFIQSYLSRIYRWKVSKLIKDGILPKPKSGDEWNHKWIPQPWAFLDPVKEISAIQMGLDVGISTLKEYQIAYGMDVDDWATQRAYELQLCRDKNIPIIHSTMSAEFYAPAAVTKPVNSAVEPLTEEDTVDNEN